MGAPNSRHYLSVETNWKSSTAVHERDRSHGPCARSLTRSTCKISHTVHVWDRSHGPRARPVHERDWSQGREQEQSHGPWVTAVTRSMCKISHSLHDLSCRVCTFSPHTTWHNWGHPAAILCCGHSTLAFPGSQDQNTSNLTALTLNLPFLTTQNQTSSC